MNTLLETCENDFTLLVEVINKFREKVKAAGFPDLHLNGVLWGLRGELINENLEQLNINSATSYVWIHHNAYLPVFNFFLMLYQISQQPNTKKLQKRTLKL